MKIEVDTVALGIPAGATDTEVIAAIARQRSDLLTAQEEVKRLNNLSKALPEGITVEELRRKLAAGLDRAQALEVLLDQARHDATKPHDKPSTKTNDAANKGLEEAGFTDMNVEELRAEVAKRNIAGVPEKATKKELLEALKRGPGAPIIA